MFSKKFHRYHLVDASPWPILTAVAAFIIAGGFALYLHQQEFGGIFLLFGLFLMGCLLALWWRDVIREATFEGKHTKKVQRGLRIGFILFIVSEVMFFASFFWAFFHSSLSPAIQIGCVWPPEGMVVFNPWGIPFLNTCILVLSGVTITYAHEAIIYGTFEDIVDAFCWTLFFAFIFTLLQYIEYVNAPFTIADGVYGSTFFMCTGFHGFHVLIGTTFIFVCFIRVMKKQMTVEHHLGFEAAAWYWHFVDVVWLFLFVMVYWWGGWTDNSI